MTSSPLSVRRAALPLLAAALLLAGCTDYRSVDWGDGTSWAEARAKALERVYPRLGDGAGGTAPIPASGQHLVMPGDTVSEIAERYGVPMERIVALNRLESPDRIYVGQLLDLEAEATRSTRTAQSGRSLAEIARRDGYRLGDLMALNPELEPLKSYPDARIRLPKARPSRDPQAAEAAREERQVAALEPSAQQPRRSLKDAATGTAPERSEEGFRWPLDGEIISGFGDKPNGTRNDGINIRARPGATVAAADNGVVVYAGDEVPAFGRMLLIRHDDDYLTAYAHNETLLVAVGDEVARGQAIAKAGNTGDVVEPQLHFEIRRGRNPLDPARHLPAAGRSVASRE